MSGGLDKVDTGMDSVVDYLGTVDTIFLFEVGIKPSFDVLQDRLP
jgi:hypothetical protein